MTKQFVTTKSNSCGELSFRAEGALTESAKTYLGTLDLRASVYFAVGVQQQISSLSAGQTYFFIAEMECACPELFEMMLGFCGDSFFVLENFASMLTWTADFRPLTSF